MSGCVGLSYQLGLNHDKSSLKTDKHFYVFGVLNILDAFTKGKECTAM